MFVPSIPCGSNGKLLLKFMFDNRIAAPSILQVKALDAPFETLRQNIVFRYLGLFNDPCVVIQDLDRNRVEESFQNILKREKPAIIQWMIDNVYSKPIYDTRAYYDQGLGVALLQDYENARRLAGVAALTSEQRIDFLTRVYLMVEDLIEEFAKSQFAPPNMPAASHPDVVKYIQTLSVFPEFRDSEFRKSDTAKDTYLKITSEIESLKKHAVDTATRQRNWAIFAAVGFGGVLLFNYVYPVIALRREKKRSGELGHARMDWRPIKVKRQL